MSILSKTRIALVFFMHLILLLPVMSCADAGKVFRDNNDAIALVLILDSEGHFRQGSGFVVGADGVIATNYHAINNAVDVKVKIGDKVFDVEGLLYANKENDLAVLKVKGEKFQTVKLGDYTKTNIGGKMYVIRNLHQRGKLESTISDGIFKGIRVFAADYVVLQITGVTSADSSGSPVFNTNGEAIGIVSDPLNTAKNIHVALPVNLIKNRIENKKIAALNGSKQETINKTLGYWLYLGYTYSAAGQYKESIEASKQAIKIRADDARAYHILGFACEKLARHAEAVEAYKQAIQIDPNDADAHINLGQNYSELGMYQESVAASEQAVRLRPDVADAYHNLAFAYEKLDKDSQAIEAYKQVIKINPADANAHYNLGFAYEKSAKYAEALEVYTEAVRVDPDDANGHHNLGFANHKLAKYDEAIESYKRAIEINPMDAEIHTDLGNAYLEAGMLKEAVEASKQASKISPDAAETHIALGTAYLESGMYTEAIESAKHAIKIKPDSTEAHRSLVDAYMASGMHMEAIEAYKQDGLSTAPAN